MFILRQITEQGKECNSKLGDNYQHYHSSTESFRDYLSKKENATSVKTKGVIVVGASVYHLIEGSQYYIMTESGKTFDRLK